VNFLVSVTKEKFRFTGQNVKREFYFEKQNVAINTTECIVFYKMQCLFDHGYVAWLNKKNLLKQI
jgi:hypothetical protein